MLSSRRPTRRRKLATIALSASALAAGALAAPLPAAASGQSSSAVTTGAPSVVTSYAPSPASGHHGGATAFAAVEPCRLHDTRADESRADGGSTTAVQVTGRCATPGTARAAAVTITVTEPAAAGYVTAWGDGPQPASSNLNFAAGQTVANSTIVPLDADGRLHYTVDTDAHVLIDVAGVFAESATSRAGRYVPVAPERLLDTRGGTAVTSGGEVEIDLPSDLPSDATAVAATVTLVDAQRDGYVTAYPAGSEQPEASIANANAGETRAASTIIPVSADGLTIATTAGGHVLVDVTGWFTGPSAAESADGLYVPVEPVRLHDSRSPRQTLDAEATREIAVPEPGAAWVVNVAGTGARADGYVTTLPARTPRPETSTLNVVTGTASSNSAITPVTEHGFAAFASAPLDIVVDGFGWFTGDPVPATTDRHPDRVAPARVLVVGDSASAGIRWSGGATDALQGAEFTIDLESCRRLVSPSCRGREGYAPTTALTAVERRSHGEFDMVVIATGYNDVDGDMPAALERISGAAHARGVQTIIWMTYREDVGYRIPSGQATSYARMNERLEADADELGITVFDWRTYTADARHWFTADNVHQTRLGSFGMADGISRMVAFVDGRDCPVPWAAGGEVEAPCPDPVPLPAERDGVPDMEALYLDQ